MGKKFYLAMLLLGLALVYGSGLLKEATGLWAIDGDTIMVELEGRREGVRYVSVNAPGLDDCLGEEAKVANDGLIRGEAVWLELDPQDGGYRRDRNQRLLAWVSLEPVQTPSASVSVLLAAQGFGRLDVREPNDSKIQEGKDFDVQYADLVIAAQMEAARARRGW
jgi:endonuclease YncB( thermonuclease family)